MIPALADRTDGLARRFLAWAQGAPDEARAAGTAKLARVTLDAEISRAERLDLIAALTLALDDPQPRVRRALAQEIADHPDAPRHLIQSLAADVPDIAAIVIARSPLLSDTDLVELVATRPQAVQTAVASRVELSAPVAAALAEVGEAEAVALVAGRRDVVIPAFSLARMAERFATDEPVMRALMARDDLPFEARYTLSVERELASRAVQDLSEQAVREAREWAALDVAATMASDDLPELVRYLRAGSHLTASLLLRCVICGPAALFHHALADLGAMPLPRVIALCGERRGGGFQALCRKVGLSSGLSRVLIDALEARRTIGPETHAGRIGQLLAARRVLAQVLQAALRRADGKDDTLLHALRRLDVALEGRQARVTAETLVPSGRTSYEPPLLLDNAVVLAAPQPAADAWDVSTAGVLAVSRALFADFGVEHEDAPQVDVRRDTGHTVAPGPLSGAWTHDETEPALSIVDEQMHADHPSAIPDEEIEVVVTAQARPAAVLRFSELVDVARQWGGVTYEAPAATPPLERQHQATAADGPALETSASPLQPPEQGSLGAGPVETVTTLSPQELAAPALSRSSLRSSPAAMAALLENAIASALTSVQPPQLGQVVLEVLRPAEVIEGEWVGVAVDVGYDPAPQRAAAA